MAIFNLSKKATTFDPKAGWIRYNGLTDIGTLNHFNRVDIFKNCTVQLQTQLLNEKGEPIGFNEKTYNVSFFSQIDCLTKLECFCVSGDPIWWLQNKSEI